MTYQTPPPPQTPSGLTASEPFVSARGRSLVVVGLFVAYIVATLAAIAVNLMRLTMPDVVLAVGDGGEQITLAGLLQLFVAIPALLIYVALIVAFLIWLHRVSKNIPALGNPKSKVEYTPGWAVGSFFIPVGNLFMPYRGVKEVWDKSDPAVTSEEGRMFSSPSSSPPLLFGWWLTWIVHNVLSNIVFRINLRAGEGQAEPFVTVLDLFADVFGIVSAALAISVVRGIVRRQQERSRHVAYVPHSAPPPPLFTPPRYQPPPHQPPPPQA